MNPEKDYLGKLVEPFTYKVSNLLEEVKSLRSRLAEVEKESAKLRQEREQIEAELAEAKAAITVKDHVLHWQ